MTTTTCPLCRKPARILGRVGEPKDGMARVWVSCTACQWSGEHEIEVTQ